MLGSHLELIMTSAASFSQSSWSSWDLRSFYGGNESRCSSIIYWYLALKSLTRNAVGRAILLNCLGEAGQQIYDALPTPEPAVKEAQAPLAAEGGEQAVQAPPDVFKETVKLPEAEFTQPANVTLQELQFHLRSSRHRQDADSTFRTL